VNDDPPDALKPRYETLFADGVLNFAHTAHVVKFYLARLEPTLDGSPGGSSTVVGQVIMPVDAFVNTTVFFEAALNRLLEAKVITKEQLEAARAVAAEQKEG
jgi:hypothetical protein